jgi:hypothetical protein
MDYSEKLGQRMREDVVETKARPRERHCHLGQCTASCDRSCVAGDAVVARRVKIGIELCGP